MSEQNYYGQILRFIPREPQVDVTLGLTVEESNAVQWANAYYQQLKSPPEQVVPAEAKESIENLCEQIRALVPVIDPHDPTDDFKKIYGTDPDMCRTYNYFNQKISEMLKGQLTRAKMIPETTDASIDDSIDAQVDTTVTSSSKVSASKDSTDSLDTLALKMFESEKTLLDQLALKYYETEKTRLDELALAQFESENTDLLDQLALEKYRNP